MTLASLVLRRKFILVKEVLDRILAVIGLILFLPVLAIVGIIIKMTSPGPVFYVQERVGKGGVPFGIIKLRTMVSDAEGSSGPVWAQANDPRITRFGRFLRASHFDEVPQLVNILRGEMSLVGPRPERPVFVEQFREQIPNYEDRLLVKPGITGMAQVYHHYDETLRDVRRKLAYDLLYVKKMCLMVDIAIIFLTFRRLTGNGAH